MLHMINSFYSKKRNKTQALLPVSIECQAMDPIHEVTCQIREMLGKQDFVQCRELIIHLMIEFPDSAQPHNLMGLLLEEEGNTARHSAISEPLPLLILLTNPLRKIFTISVSFSIPVRVHLRIRTAWNRWAQVIVSFVLTKMELAMSPTR